MTVPRKLNPRTKGLWLGLGLAAGAALYLAGQQRKSARRAAWNGKMAEESDSRVALVTGASSGIGAAYARSLAALGYNLILVARREERLGQLAVECKERHGVESEVLVADLSTQKGIAAVEKRIVTGGDIDFLVNNAGYDVFGAFADVPSKKILALINCLATANVRFCRAALPGMLKRRRGAIVNVTSIGAFVAKPYDTTYVASKAFLNLFSESLAGEVQAAGVRVQALCPGFTLSEFHDDPQFAKYRIKERIPRWLWMTPEAVVAESLRALGEDRRVCVPGWKNRFIVFAGRSGLSSSLMELLRFFLVKKGEHVSWKNPNAALDLLACPICRADLELRGDFSDGVLVCTGCMKEYPIENGVPHFVSYEDLTGLDRRFARLYDWFSYVYLPFSKVASLLVGGEEKSRRTMLDRLEPRGGKVLEISIGPGINLPYLVSNPEVGEMYGLDISLGQISHCQDYSRKKALPVNLYLANAESLPFKDNSFDCVFHIGGINFFSDRKKAIDEMIRVAQPGTKILIADESERGARGFEISLPGFKKSFDSKRQAVKPPVDLLPSEMEEVCLDETAWGGWFYCLTFRKPNSAVKRP
jgi:short-subunit dehydrogenase/ubiquinone/menaquinone biosynthesis C-methylase UbiE/uncharacterized protein YbaR (Trm112 family)